MEKEMFYKLVEEKTKEIFKERFFVSDLQIDRITLGDDGICTVIINHVLVSVKIDRLILDNKYKIGVKKYAEIIIKKIIDTIFIDYFKGE